MISCSNYGRNDQTSLHGRDSDRNRSAGARGTRDIQIGVDVGCPLSHAANSKSKQITSHSEAAPVVNNVESDQVAFILHPDRNAHRICMADGVRDRLLPNPVKLRFHLPGKLARGAAR